jgi:hypothetical protein
MLNENKLATIMDILDQFDRHQLYKKGVRRQLGRRIAEGIGMYEGRVQEFLGELDGLDWQNDDDYNFFIDYLARGL